MNRKARKKVPDDPVVAEVRRWRARLMKDAGGTVQGLMVYLDSHEAHRARRNSVRKKSAIKSSGRDRAA